MTIFSWEFLCSKALRDLNERVLYSTFFHSDRISEYAQKFPDTRPPLCLSRTEITQVYYLIEVLYNKDGWLHERPSNHRHGKMRGYKAEATYVQIHRMFSTMWQHEHLFNVTFETLTFEQKLLYFYLLKKWGL